MFKMIQYSTDFECKIYRKKSRGWPRRMWMDDIYEWSANKTPGEMKRLAADRETWRKMIMTDQPSDKKMAPMNE